MAKHPKRARGKDHGARQVIIRYLKSLAKSSKPLAIALLITILGTAAIATFLRFTRPITLFVVKEFDVPPSVIPEISVNGQTAANELAAALSSLSSDQNALYTSSKSGRERGRMRIAAEGTPIEIM